MVLRAFNTLTGRKEEVDLPKDRPVRIYVCGITPYSSTHLGHARPAVFWDTVAKYLEYRGNEVYMVQNVTDVNEKVWTRSQLEGVGEKELARRYNREYEDVLEDLGITTIDEYPWVSDHIDEIIDMVEALIEQGHAYQVDEDVFFDVSTFERYGQLSGQSPDELVAGARVEVDERKKHPADFALWKSPTENQPSWPSPWGQGRPGWHIECSAMAIKFLGFGFDFHGGGTDLIFPHHENEIAQSEAYADDSPFVRCWIHHGMITGEDGKMSKSLGNFVTADELLSEYRPEVVRHFLLSAHYSTPLKYSEEIMKKSQRAFDRLISCVQSLDQLLDSNPEEDVPLADSEAEEVYAVADEMKREFCSAMDDDFNTARALAALFGGVRKVNGFINTPDFALSADVKQALADVKDQLEICSRILGVWPEKGILQDDAGPDTVGLESEAQQELVQLLIEVRQEAREKKLWGIADKIRDGLAELNIRLEDTPQGTRVRSTREG